MTMDRSLKLSGGLMRSRSVLTRAERIKKLQEEDQFDPETTSPMGLPKVRVKHSKAGTKTKKAAEEKPVEGAAAPGEEGAAAPAGKEAPGKAPAGKAPPGKEAPAGKAAPAGKGASAGKAGKGKS